MGSTASPSEHLGLHPHGRTSTLRCSAWRLVRTGSDGAALVFLQRVVVERVVVPLVVVVEVVVVFLIVVVIELVDASLGEEALARDTRFVTGLSTGVTTVESLVTGPRCA